MLDKIRNALRGRARAQLEGLTANDLEEARQEAAQAASDAARELEELEGRYLGGASDEDLAAHAAAINLARLRVRAYADSERDLSQALDVARKREREEKARARAKVILRELEESAAACDAAAATLARHAALADELASDEVRTHLVDEPPKDLVERVMRHLPEEHRLVRLAGSGYPIAAATELEYPILVQAGDDLRLVHPELITALDLAEARARLLKWEADRPEDFDRITAFPGSTAFRQLKDITNELRVTPNPAGRRILSPGIDRGGTVP